MGLKAIFKEGMAEFRRRGSVRKEKRNLWGQESQVSGQMTALGKKAWEGKLNLNDFSDLKQILTDNQKLVSEVQTEQDKLKKLKGEKENKRKEENERFIAERKTVEDQKKALDKQLSGEKNLLATWQREREQASSRLARIPLEKSQLNEKIQSASVPEMDKPQLKQKLESLNLEETENQRKVKERNEAIPTQEAKVAPLQKESDMLQIKINGIAAEQKKTVGDLDQALSDLNKQLNEQDKKYRELDQTRSKYFLQLGEKLAASNTADPIVETEMTAVRNTKQQIAGIQTQIKTLEQQGNAGAAKAYKTMLAIIIGGVLALAILIIILVNVLSPGQPLKPANPYEGIFQGSCVKQENNFKMVT